jgi:hypothetical protein
MKTINIAFGHVFPAPGQSGRIVDEIEKAVQVALLDAGFRTREDPQDQPVELSITINVGEVK